MKQLLTVIPLPHELCAELRAAPDLEWVVGYWKQRIAQLRADTVSWSPASVEYLSVLVWDECTGNLKTLCFIYEEPAGDPPATRPLARFNTFKITALLHQRRLFFWCGGKACIGPVPSQRRGSRGCRPRDLHCDQRRMCEARLGARNLAMSALLLMDVLHAL